MGKKDQPHLEPTPILDASPWRSAAVDELKSRHHLHSCNTGMINSPGKCAGVGKACLLSVVGLQVAAFIVHRLFAGYRIS
ncbi:MAG TPA: hypothetical protein VHV83_07700 [Armatimonadota bacterium]|nr:hypothetical protein [Armatimonadota bacterium]